MLYLQSTKTYCQSHKLPVCPNRERSFVVEGEGEHFTCMRSPLEAECFLVFGFFFNYYDYFRKLQKFKIIYFKNL